ncbi:MAG: helix-turn-helix domain-containing protein [Chitinophagaceae bacterium]|nr:helix-turn-helix domain-containing protein [Chitinophagaceae bacterium]
MSVERNELFDLAFRFVTETQESIFLTGKAGTGKTTFLKYLQNHCAKNTVVAAPTGVAAINAGGVTLHSLFQLPFHPFLPTENNRLELLKNIRYQKQRLTLLRKMELLVIDEVSMVRADVMDAIDAILRSVRHQHHVPFGGVQLLLIGDLYQLPPVAKNDEWNLLRDYYNSTFFFDSLAIKDQQPLLIELTKIYRQKEESFVQLLNKVRNNYMEREDFEQLNNRYIPGFRPAADEKYITLTSHNNQADQINQSKLQSLSAPAFTYSAKIEGDFPEHLYPAENELVLKEGAQVMFLKNDTESKKYFNGKIGTVVRLEKDKIVVNSDGIEIEVKHEVWENTRYTINRSDEKLQQEVLGTFSQYPLRLAWAITIHKSQGLTFDRVMIDAAASFSSGQVYVALSRCTSLDGIVLLTPIPPSAINTNTHVVNAQSSLASKGSLADRFAGARHVFTLQLIEEIFSLTEMQQSLAALNKQVQLQATKLNDASTEWLRSFTEKYNQQKSVADKFAIRAHELMKDDAVIENNPVLQKRINDAAGYFIPVINRLKDELQHHEIITEHKEVAAILDDPLQELMHAFIKTSYYLQYALKSFEVAGFLQHKLNLTIPRIQITSYAANKKQTAVSGDIPNPDLYFTLKNWRDRICTQENLPVYLVANSDTLKEICLYLPLTKQHLLLLSGFGKAKAERFGDEILDMVESYCNQHGLETNIEAKSASPKRQRKERTEPKEEKTPTKLITFNLYKEGKTVTEIAALRVLAASTIEGHLADMVRTGEIEVNELVSTEKMERIKQAFRDGIEEEKFGELRSRIGGDITYAEIKAVANHLHWMKVKSSASSAKNTE